MSSIFFSVVLPTNALGEYLDIAIESILSQQYPSFELLLIVNGPEHESIAFSIRQRYVNDDRVVVLSTPICKLPFALNLGIDKAKGQYVVRMDADDISFPNRLSTLARRIESDAELDVIGSNYQIIDGSGQSCGYSKQLTGNAAIRFRLPFNCQLAHPTLCIRRSLLLEVGGYMYGVASEDYDLWLRLLRRRPKVVFDNLSDVLLQYRFHAGQTTSKQRTGEFVAHDIGLRLREFLLTGNPVYLLGIGRSIVQLVYRKFAKR